MTRLHFIARPSPAWLGSLLLAVATLGAAAAPTQRVLMLFREDSQVPATRMLEQAVRNKVGTLPAGAVEVYVEYLDANRFADERHYQSFREYLRAKYAERRPDVVLMVLTPAFDFAGGRPAELLPGVPVVFVAVNSTELPGPSLGDQVTGIVARPDLRGTVAGIFRLQPDTRRIVVIGGSAAMDRMALAQAEQVSQEFAGQAHFEFWTNQPLRDLQVQVAALSRQTAVLYTGIFRDAAGGAYFPAQAVQWLAQEASAPIYVYLNSQLGSGAVGGVLVSYDHLGAWAGDAVLRVLRGVPAAPQPITVLTRGTPMFDWLALRRWGISEARLPPGSLVEFRQPTVWSKYRWRIVGLGLFILAQTGLIIGLLMSRAKRREAETVATLIAGLSSKFINLPPDEVDREILDAQRRVCEGLGLELSVLWQWSPNDPDLLTLTHLYRPLGGPPVPERMNAHEYFPWALQQVRAGRVIKFGSLDEAPTSAARDLEMWRHYGVKTLLNIPLAAGGGPPFGCVSFHAVRAERAWTEDIVSRLTLVAQVFANALARKIADRSLQESEARLSLAADAAGAGLWRLNLTTGQYWLTNKARALFGFAADEVVTLERFLSLVHPEDQARIRQVVDEVVQSKTEARVEYRVIRPDGSLQWMHSRGRVHCDPSGKPVDLMEVSLDITEHRRAELEIQELRTRLAHSGRVTLLGQLASALAHQLSQPLGAILRNAEAAEMLLRQPAPDWEELRAIVTDIHQDDQRAGEVIDRLRSLLKRQTLDPQPLRLDVVITEVLSLLRADAAARKVNIECQIAPGLPLARCDRIHLQQVLLNLLVNAMDALTPCEPGARNIQVNVRAKEAGMIAVRICDNGPGLPVESLNRLFEPFFTTKANGMGMGLAVSKTIIEAHKGRIWAENRPEGGACFCFTLPAVGDNVKAEGG